ncbi:MAG: hypothetical protein CVT48_05130 [Thermoplasmata archaeon HGW-Thermoplasmata-1]|nr:MAG: hypothetical protein CVT48_05130 [Thermoplasmata archaeon HGW-Thermoplasmata-1]
MMLVTSFAGCIDTNLEDQEVEQPPAIEETARVGLFYYQNLSKADIVVESVTGKIPWNATSVQVIDESSKCISYVEIPFRNRTVHAYDRISIPDLIFGQKYAVSFVHHEKTLGSVTFTLPKVTISLRASTTQNSAIITVESITYTIVKFSDVELKLTDSDSGEVRCLSPTEKDLDLIEKGDTINAPGLTSQHKYLFTIIHTKTRTVLGSTSFTTPKTTQTQETPPTTPTISIEVKIVDTTTATCTVKSISQNNIGWNSVNIRFTDKTGGNPPILYAPAGDSLVSSGDIIRMEGLTEGHSYEIYFYYTPTNGKMGSAPFTMGTVRITMSVRSYGTEATITVESVSQDNIQWGNCRVKLTNKSTGGEKYLPLPSAPLPSGTVEKGDTITLSDTFAKHEYLLTVFSNSTTGELYGSITWKYQTPKVTLEANPTSGDNTTAGCTVKSVDQQGVKWSDVNITLTDRDTGGKRYFNSSKIASDTGDEKLSVGDAFLAELLTPTHAYMVIFIDHLTDGEMGKVEWTQPK